MIYFVAVIFISVKMYGYGAFVARDEKIYILPRVYLAKNKQIYHYSVYVAYILCVARRVFALSFEKAIIVNYESFTNIIKL